MSAAAFTILLYYLIANIAALKLSASNKIYPKWIAVLGIVCCLALALSLRTDVIAYGLLMLAVGHLLRPIFRWVNRK
jgi:APA family basic amino acid/polyamine antiporter